MLFGYFSALIINGGIVYAENNVFFSSKYRPDHNFFLLIKENYCSSVS